MVRWDVSGAIDMTAFRVISILDFIHWSGQDADEFPAAAKRKSDTDDQHYLHRITWMFRQQK